MTASSPHDPALLAEPRPALAAVQAIYSRAALPDPYPLYRQARQYGEVVAVPEWNAAALFGHAEVSAALRSPAALSGEQLGGDENLSALPEAAKVVAEQEDLVRRIVQQRLAAVSAGPFDLVTELATPLPVAVITGMLGLSSADEGQFLLWTQSVAELLGGVDTSPELLARIESDAREMRSYFRDLADELRAHPQPGLLSALAAAEDEAGRLSSDEILANAVLLLAAGHETTSNLIGRGVLALHQQAGAWAELLALPDISSAVADELLRFTSPVQLTGRTLGAALELGGQLYPAGTRLLLMLAAANRDPRTFEAPERLDFQRSNSARHLAFASGPHYCLGASLARLETRVVFGELARFPRLRVLEQPLHYRPNLTLRGLSTLMVELEPALG